MHKWAAALIPLRYRQRVHRMTPWINADQNANKRLTPPFRFQRVIRDTMLRQRVDERAPNIHFAPTKRRSEYYMRLATDMMTSLTPRRKSSNRRVVSIQPIMSYHPEKPNATRNKQLCNALFSWIIWTNHPSEHYLEHTTSRECHHSRNYPVDLRIVPTNASLGNYDINSS